MKLISKLESLKKEEDLNVPFEEFSLEHRDIGYNQAISDIITLLEGVRLDEEETARVLLTNEVKSVGVEAVEALSNNAKDLLEVEND